MTKADLIKYMYENNVRGDLSIEDMAEDLATPEAEWLEITDGGYWKCSHCNSPTEASAAKTIYEYCPFCNAHMWTLDDAEWGKSRWKGPNIQCTLSIQMDLPYPTPASVVQLTSCSQAANKLKKK